MSFTFSETFLCFPQRRMLHARAGALRPTTAFFTINYLLSISLSILVSLIVFLFCIFAVSPRADLSLPCRNSSYPQPSVSTLLEEAEFALKKNLRRQSIAKSKIDCYGSSNYLTCGLHILHMVYMIPPYPCPRQLHLAEWGEGGKWVCDIPKAIPRKTALIYSVGSNGETGFEQAINEEFGAKTFVFDPTLLLQHLDRIRFIPYINYLEIGLTSPGVNQSLGISRTAKMMTVDSLMSLLGHSYVHVFKMDCEGCERGFLNHLMDISTRERPLFGQMLIEFHNLKQLEPSRAMFVALESLGYILFHAEANFYSPSDCWELAFIHESVIASAKA